MQVRRGPAGPTRRGLGTAGATIGWGEALWASTAVRNVLRTRSVSIPWSSETHWSLGTSASVSAAQVASAVALSLPRATSQAVTSV